MTPSESDRTVAACGKCDAAGAVDRRGVEVDQSPSSAVGERRLAGGDMAPGVRAVSYRPGDEAPRARRPPFFGAPTLGGEVAEGSKAPHSKCGLPFRVP
jgi:hypothetical protein